MTYNVFSGTLNPTHFTSLHFASCYLPQHHKSRRNFLLAPAHPGDPEKKAVKRLWRGGGDGVRSLNVN